jgi:uncharacterized membrane protein YsdA (DUF1294 family)
MIGTIYIMISVVILFILYADDKRQVKKQTRKHIRERRVYEESLKR